MERVVINIQGSFVKNHHSSNNDSCAGLRVRRFLTNGLSGQLGLLALDRYKTEHDFSGLGPLDRRAPAHTLSPSSAGKNAQSGWSNFTKNWYSWNSQTQNFNPGIYISRSVCKKVVMTFFHDIFLGLTLGRTLLPNKGWKRWSGRDKTKSYLTKRLSGHKIKLISG